MPRPIWRPDLDDMGEPERIMAYGGTTAGKSFAAAMIALKLGPEDTMYVIDTDNAWSKMLKETGLRAREVWLGKVRRLELEVEGGKIVWYRVKGWDQFLEAVNDALARALPNDWVTVDSLTWPWQWLGDWYTRKVYGEEMPDFLLQHRVQQEENKRKKSGGQDALVVDYNYINPIWFRMAGELLVTPPCHVFVTAESKPIRTDAQGANALTRQTFGFIGFQPSTQNRAAFNVNSIIYVERNALEQYKITTAKDRGGREKLDQVEFTDFFDTYLRDVAGWEKQR